MHGLKGIRKDRFDAGHKQCVRGNHFGTGTDSKSSHEPLTRYEVGGPELLARDHSAKASANITGHFDQPAFDFAYPIIDTPSHVLDANSRFKGAENCFSCIDEGWQFIFQSPQETFNSDAFPDLIWEPFNPKHPNIHQGTIDPRSNPGSFEDLLKSLRPRRFDPNPSFSIDMRRWDRENAGWAREPGTGRFYYVDDSSQPRSTSLIKHVIQPQENEITRSRVQNNIEAMPHANDDNFEACGIDSKKGASAQKCGLDTHLPNPAERFRPSIFDGGPLACENALQDSIEPHRPCPTVASHASSSRGETKLDDQRSTHDSASQEKAKDPQSLTNNPKKRMFPTEEISAHHDAREITAKSLSSLTNGPKKRSCTIQEPAAYQNAREEKVKSLPGLTTKPRTRKSPKDISVRHDPGEENLKSLPTSRIELNKHRSSAKPGTDIKPYRGQKKAPDRGWTTAEGEIVAAELQRLQEDDKSTPGKRVDHSENLYERASTTLRSQGILRNPGSLRAYMNRKGRARHGYDERKEPKDRKSVGPQPLRSKIQRRAHKAKQEAERVERAAREQSQARARLVGEQYASNVGVPQPMASGYAQRPAMSPFAREGAADLTRPAELAAGTMQEREVQSEGESVAEILAENEEETAAWRARGEEIIARMRVSVERWNRVEHNQAAQNAIRMAQEQAENEELDRLEAEQRKRMPSDELEDGPRSFGFKRFKKMPDPEGSGSTLEQREDLGV